MNHDYSPDSMSSSALLTFAVGAVAGAAVALLFAPSAGRDTRALLADRSRGMADKGRELVDKGREMVNDQTARVSDVIARGRDQALEVGERIGHAVEQGKAGYRDALRQGQGVADEAVKTAEQAARALRGAPTYTPGA